ncbi:MAG: DNA-directed RNA polymerase subunit beta, partial [Candidatus Omnitrophica bacterium]|nr:DNA-directed RNA polymerase subunit beta [Candidatus Omnitrophota bacterium]
MIKRKSFAKFKEVMDLPNLLEIQYASYIEFLQMDTPPLERKRIGLQEVFDAIFPLENADRTIRLEFISYTLGKPKYNIVECKKRAMSYASPLKVKFRLTTQRETKEQDAYFGEIPLMTENGSFIINGDERGVISQIQRSPGVCFEEEDHPTGKKIFYGRIIPYR